MFQKTIDDLMDFSRSPVLRFIRAGLKRIYTSKDESKDEDPLDNLIEFPGNRASLEDTVPASHIRLAGNQTYTIVAPDGQQVIYTVEVASSPKNKLPENRIQTNRFSDEQKRVIIHALFSEYNPGYAWYDLGVGSGSDLVWKVEANKASILMQTGAPGDFGCLEVHNSEFLPGYVLRVRDASLIPARLTIGNLEAPLYLVNLTNPGFIGGADIRVNFGEGAVYAPVDKREFVESLGLEYRPCDRTYAIKLVSPLSEAQE